MNKASSPKKEKAFCWVQVMNTCVATDIVLEEVCFRNLETFNSVSHCLFLSPIVPFVFDRLGDGSELPAFPDHVRFLF